MESILENIPADLLIDLKRDVNRGIAKIFTQSRVGYTQKTLTSNLVANQQYYQVAPDCIRPTTIQVVAQGLFATLPLMEVPTIAKWNEINVWPQLSFPWPTYYFVRGHNQVGLWPTPGAAQANGLIITYEATPPEMAIDDISSTSNIYTPQLTPAHLLPRTYVTIVTWYHSQRQLLTCLVTTYTS